MDGLLFRAGDPVALAQAVIAAFNRTDGGAVIRQRARQFVEQERTWENSVAHYRTIYAQALGRATAELP